MQDRGRSVRNAREGGRLARASRQGNPRLLDGGDPELTSILAEAGVGIFAVSTYNTDYILFKEKDYKRAISALGGSGHTIVLKRVTMRA
ncbi:MAG: ACT domain-containing protein [Candidatus Methanomethylophilaceae archaeon]|nr:ACT domain-containing protein [Candidatus Methanomethylophilaceae archaeon]